MPGYPARLPARHPDPSSVNIIRDSRGMPSARLCLVISTTLLTAAGAMRESGDPDPTFLSDGTGSAAGSSTETRRPDLEISPELWRRCAVLRPPRLPGG